VTGPVDGAAGGTSAAPSPVDLAEFTLVESELDRRWGETTIEPSLTRIGVGNHLILGGDNMDLALAHLVESRMAEQAGEDATRTRLSSARLAQLTERCRAAKEQLLADDGPDSVGVTLLGAGSRLIGASRKAELHRGDIERIVLDGFFPLNPEREEARRARAGIVEFGLPYASDAAVTRHLAGFLRQHAAAAREALGITGDDVIPVPDTLLLNGGVFRGAALARRLTDTLAGWRGAPLRVWRVPARCMATAAAISPWRFPPPTPSRTCRARRKGWCCSTWASTW